MKRYQIFEVVLYRFSAEVSETFMKFRLCPLGKVDSIKVFSELLCKH